MGIGDVIKKYRVRRHLTQEKLAKKCGLKKVTIYQYEAGKRTPNFARAAIIANALANNEEERNFILQQFVAKCFDKTDACEANFHQQTAGESIRRYRKQKNLTQKQLAKKINVAQSTYSQWESGRRNPKPSTICRIAEALDVEPANIIDG